MTYDDDGFEPERPAADDLSEFERAADMLDSDDDLAREKSLAWLQGYAAGAEAVRECQRLAELSTKAWEARMASSGWRKP